QFNNFANNPFGIDPNQLMNMLGNVDGDKMKNIMESMDKEGIDLNSFMAQNGMNPGNNGMNQGNPGMNNNGNQGAGNNMNPMDILKNMGMNQGNAGMNNGNPGMNGNMGSMGNMNPMAILSQLTQMGNFNGQNKNNNNNGNNNNNRKNNKKNKYNTGDANMDMLLAVRDSVDSERIEFVDKIIGMYKKGDLD
ncbi:hypothetical protein, partial [Clostridium sp.]|uniref:hypothetical protein n=1 Tax=Clostridium sp. TaxID=1506 RepID=UPI002FCB1641